MKALVIALLFIILSFPTLRAQSGYSHGYIITNEKDTTFGFINPNIKPGAGKVKFMDENGKKKSYYPRQIRSFVINDSIVYQSILQTENADAAAFELFAKLLVDGYLKLLATHNKTGSIFKSKNDSTLESNNYYLQNKATEEYFKLTKMGFRGQLADRVSDYVELRREVSNKVYIYNEIPEVVEKYNAWKNAKQ